MNKHVDKSEQYIDIIASRGRIKILKTLYTQGEINITRIVKLTNLNHKSVESHLRYLIEKGIVREKKLGRIKLYSLNYTNPDATVILQLLDKLSDY